MSRILLTGGSGFIGSHFHRHMSHGDIVNLDLRDPFFEHGATFLKGDIRVKGDIVKAIDGKGINCIISLAAKHHDFGIGHDEYFDTNEEGTRILCEVAGEGGIDRIIFFSSVAVYGLRPEVSQEGMEALPDSPYGASKLAGEKVLRKWAAEKPGRHVVIIRPALVFGADNVANMFNLIRQIDSRLYFHLGKANNIKSIAYVENVVQATLFLMDRMKPGVAVYNYADEPQLTAREIGEAIATALGKRAPFTVPKVIGRMAGLPFDLAIKLTGKNLAISSTRIKKLGTETHHSAKKIFDEGFSPKHSTVDGIKKMVEWYKSRANK